MNTSGPRSRNAYSQPACVFRISTCGKCSSFFVAYLNKSQPILVSAQRLKHAVDPVPRKAKNHFDAPINKSVHDHVSNGHHTLLVSVASINFYDGLSMFARLGLLFGVLLLVQ